MWAKAVCQPWRSVVSLPPIVGHGVFVPFLAVWERHAHNRASHHEAIANIKTIRSQLFVMPKNQLTYWLNTLFNELGQYGVGKGQSRVGVFLSSKECQAAFGAKVGVDMLQHVGSSGPEARTCIPPFVSNGFDHRIGVQPNQCSDGGIIHA